MTREELKRATDKGIVTWCIDPPEGMPEPLHRFSIINAIEAGKNFLGVAMNRPSVLVGSVARGVIESLPQFSAGRSQIEEFLCIGYLGEMPVLVDGTLPERNFMVSDRLGFVKGHIVNGPPKPVAA